MLPRPLKRLLKTIITWIYLTSPRRVRAAIGKVDENWRLRINDVLSCQDNAFIPRVSNAGVVEKYYITMHNGVKVCANGYYGSGILNMLIENRGVHEPQEERAFGNIIPLLPEYPVMLELGAYWGFYSLSLLQARPKANCFLVEPDIVNMASGKLNFRLNHRKGHFTLSEVSDRLDLKENYISVDSFCEQNFINHVHILHSDIQGYELPMLKGAKTMLSTHRIDYVFISTHSNDLHTACTTELINNQYIILASANMDQTYSVDGLIVARRSSLAEPHTLEISVKQVQQAAAPLRRTVCAEGEP